MSDLEELRRAIVKFTQERDWDQFHNGKDLAIGLPIEACELLEAFLWKEPENVYHDKLANIIVTKPDLRPSVAYATTNRRT